MAASSPAAVVPSRGRSVAKPELGNKHQCQNCGAKFFDLNKNPITCPKCGTVLQAKAVSRAAAQGRRRPMTTNRTRAGAELVTLEDAEVDADKIAVVVDDRCRGRRSRRRHLPGGGRGGRRRCRRPHRRRAGGRRRTLGDRARFALVRPVGCGYTPALAAASGGAETRRPAQTDGAPGANEGLGP